MAIKVKQFILKDFLTANPGGYLACKTGDGPEAFINHFYCS